MEIGLVLVTLLLFANVASIFELLFGKNRAITSADLSAAEEAQQSPYVRDARLHRVVMISWAVFVMPFILLLTLNLAGMERGPVQDAIIVVGLVTSLCAFGTVCTVEFLKVLRRGLIVDFDGKLYSRRFHTREFWKIAGVRAAAVIGIMGVAVWSITTKIL